MLGGPTRGACKRPVVLVCVGFWINKRLEITVLCCVFLPILP